MEESGVSLEIVIGTYEEFLLGYQLSKGENGYQLKQCFANQAHIGSIRCVDASSKYVASGSVDESIKLLNMKTRNEFGTLLQHNGTINSLEFIGDSHLVSGSEDGNVCIFTATNWQCQKTLRGHKKGVNCVSVHPSKKLILSVSKDKSLRTWNLVKGRSAYVTNIKDVSEFVKWSPSGSHFVLAVKNRLDIYDTTQAGIIHTIDFGSHISTADFLNENVVVIGGESNEIQFHCLESKSCLNTFKAHEKRIKVLKSLEIDEKRRWLVSTSSDGYIKIWEIKMKSLKKEPKLISQVNTKCRPTCLALFQVKSNFEKRPNEGLNAEDSSTKKKKKEI